MADEEAMDESWEDALGEDSDKAEQDKGGDDWDNLAGGDSGADTANFEELGAGEMSKGGTQNLEFLLDIPLEVSVELGRSSMIIDRMLQLTQGSVIELEKAAGETVEIYVNKKLLGKGEVIVVNDRFGVRITEIISRADRIKNMG